MKPMTLGVEEEFLVVDAATGALVPRSHQLLPRATANGIVSCIALTLTENGAARRLLRRAGFRTVESSHGVAEMRLELSAPLRLAA